MASDAENLTLWFDGLCEPRNPGGVACCGWVVKSGKKLVAKDFREVVRGPNATNNVAEWCALGFALRWLLTYEQRIHALKIHGDSQLVINQLNMQWQCRKPNLKRMRDRCLDLLYEIKPYSWDAEWVPRDRNTEADGLSRQAYIEATGKSCSTRG